MASLVLSGDTSGSITLAAPAVAGSTTQTLVNVTGTLAPIVSGTAQASTSGTAITFTSVIPSWARRVTVMFNSVSTNSTNPFVIQLGTGGVITTSGYLGTGFSHNTTGISAAGYTNGLVPVGGALSAANTYQGICTFCNVSGNTWTGTGIIQSTGGSGGFGSTVITLSGVLDSLRVIASATGAPSDTFDAGSINILYE
jgi:hypothetical protein